MADASPAAVAESVTTAVTRDQMVETLPARQLRREALHSQIANHHNRERGISHTECEVQATGET